MYAGQPASRHETPPRVGAYISQLIADQTIPLLEKKEVLADLQDTFSRLRRHSEMGYESDLQAEDVQTVKDIIDEPGATPSFDDALCVVVTEKPYPTAALATFSERDTRLVCGSCALQSICPVTPLGSAVES